VEIMWPDAVASSVPAFKLQWVVIYNETFLMMAIPLRAWRKPVAFFVVGKGLGPSAMHSARIHLPGSCCGAARFFKTVILSLRLGFLARILELERPDGRGDCFPPNRFTVLYSQVWRSCSLNFFSLAAQFVPRTLRLILRGFCTQMCPRIEDPGRL